MCILQALLELCQEEGSSWTWFRVTHIYHYWRVVALAIGYVSVLFAVVGRLPAAGSWRGRRGSEGRPRAGARGDVWPFTPFMGGVGSRRPLAEREAAGGGDGPLARLALARLADLDAGAAWRAGSDQSPG